RCVVCVSALGVLVAKSAHRVTGVATFILLADIGNQRLWTLDFDSEGGDQRVFRVNDNVSRFPLNFKTDCKLHLRALLLSAKCSTFRQAGIWLSFSIGIRGMHCVGPLYPATGPTASFSTGNCSRSCNAFNPNSKVCDRKLIGALSLPLIRPHCGSVNGRPMGIKGEQQALLIALQARLQPFERIFVTKNDHSIALSCPQNRTARRV